MSRTSPVRPSGKALSVTVTEIVCPPPVTVKVPVPPESPAKNETIFLPGATLINPIVVDQVKPATPTSLWYASSPEAVRIVPLPVATLTDVVEATSEFRSPAPLRWPVCSPGPRRPHPKSRTQVAEPVTNGSG